MRTKVINIDPEILSGTPVFNGTRVPVEILFDHLETGLSIEDFLDDYPSIRKSQVIQVLEMAGKLFSSKDIQKINETVA
jgi:uncharacterized protein (DUF433 family)